jgi:competence protein ComEC
MAGGGTTIIRASAMAIIALYAKWTGNTYNAFRALMVCGLGMILLNPLTLLYDPSFHLSFMATFALIVFTPYTQRLFGKFGDSVMGQIIASTLTIELFLLPYLLWMNGEFAMIAFLANVLVLAFIPATMLAGFVAVMVSHVHFGFAYVFAFISFVTLHYIMRIVEIASLFTGFAIRW